MADQGSIPPPGARPPAPQGMPQQSQKSDVPLPDVAALLSSSSTTKTTSKSTRYLAFFGGLGVIVLLAILIPGSGGKQITLNPVSVERLNDELTITASDGKTYVMHGVTAGSSVSALETYKCDVDGNELSNCKRAASAEAPPATPAAPSGENVTVKIADKLGAGTVNGQPTPMYIGSGSASYEVADAQTFDSLQPGQTYVCKNAGPATQNGTKAFGFPASAKISGCTPQ